MTRLAPAQHPGSPGAARVAAAALPWSVPADRAALGAFLRSRRDRLTPAQAGMRAFPGPRRVPGLRKEELAVLAGVSADYYSRLEQGRQATVSTEVLTALASALRLDDVELTHLLDLAAPAPRRPARESPQRPSPGLLRLMEALEHRPVLLLGRRGDVLARNDLLQAVLGRSLDPGSSFVRFLLLDPQARTWIVNWDEFASALVAGLRRELGRHPHDVRLLDLIADVRAADADVARWWDDHGVSDPASVTKVVDHPDAGRLEFGIESVTGPREPDQVLVVYTAPAGSPTARMLPILASWTAPQPVADGATVPE